MWTGRSLKSFPRHPRQLRTDRPSDRACRARARARALHQAPRRPALGNADEGQGRHRPCRLCDGGRPPRRGRERFPQEDAEDPATRNRIGPEAGKGGQMTRKFIPVEQAFADWRKDPDYVAAYDALEEEFALAAALIKARADAD